MLGEKCYFSIRPGPYYWQIQYATINVQSEPILHLLNGKVFSQTTSFTDNDARLYIGACGFWGGRFEKTYIHVQVLI